eukprot:34167_1
MAHIIRKGAQSLKRNTKSIPTPKQLLLNAIRHQSHSIASRPLLAHRKHTHNLSPYTHTKASIQSIAHRKFRKFHSKHHLSTHNTRHFNHSSSQKRDYYDVLGISRDVKDSEVKKAFYKLAKQWHPDANKAPEAKDKFSEINEAYQILSNKEKRAQYDQFGHAGAQMGGMGGFNPADINLNDLFENLFGGGGPGGGFPFGDIFGNGQQMHDPTQPEQGRDMQIDVPLSFMEAVNGAKRELKVQRFDECTTCNSSGVEAGTTPTKCSTCNGKGKMVQQSGFMVIQQTCWECNGMGSKAKNCHVCQGAGLKSNVSTLDVNIPAGVDDGTRVRIAHQGHCGKNRGGRGHCWLLCRVKGDERFERNGSDVHVAVDVPVYKAILGGTVTVPTLSGEAEVKVKPGTQSEHREIMRGKGITEPSTGRKGHQYLHFNVIVPTHLSNEQRD